VRELIDLLKEANQEVPGFLESIAREGGGFGGRGGRSGGGRGRGQAATRDVRTFGGGQRPGYAGGMGMGGGMGGGSGYGGGPGMGMGGGMGGGGGYGNPSGPSSWW
jgi:ATP-dependent RNA helicase DDX3X